MSEQLTWTILPADNLNRHALLWDEINEKLGQSPLLTSGFTLACLRHFGSGKEVLAIGRRQDGQAEVVALVRYDSAIQAGVFQPSQAPMGFWLCVSSLPIAQLVAGLLPRLKKTLLVFSISQLDPDIHPRPEPDSRIRLDDYIPTARISVAEPWESYWAKRGKNLRQNHRKAMNRATKNNATVRFVTHDTPDSVAEAVGVYGDIESRSWKAEGGTSIGRENAQGKFYQTVLSELAKTAQARAHIMLVDANPAAVDLCIRSGGRLIILKTTFDATYKDYSPASLLREYYFAQEFDAGEIREIEFYGRVMDWHVRWTDEVRTLYHITFFRSAWLLRLKHLKNSKQSAH